MSETENNEEEFEMPPGGIPLDEDGNILPQNGEEEGENAFEGVFDDEGESDEGDKTAEELTPIGSARFEGDYQRMAKTLVSMFGVTIDPKNEQYLISTTLEDGREFTATYKPVTKTALDEYKREVEERYGGSPDKPVNTLELAVTPVEGNEAQFGIEMIDKGISGLCNSFRMYGGPGGCVDMKEEKKDNDVESKWVGQKQYTNHLAIAFDTFVIGYIKNLDKAEDKAAE